MKNNGASLSCDYVVKFDEAQLNVARTGNTKMTPWNRRYSISNLSMSRIFFIFPQSFYSFSNFRTVIYITSPGNGLCECVSHIPIHFGHQLLNRLLIKLYTLFRCQISESCHVCHCHLSTPTNASTGRLKRNGARRWMNPPFY